MSENIRQFIDQLASGQNSEAKDALENELSGRSFAALDEYKKELAKGIFGGGQEESQEELAMEEDFELDENYEQLDENMKQAVSLMKKANSEHIDKDIHSHYPKILDAVKKSGNTELHKKLSHHFGKAIEHNKQKHAAWNKAGERPSAAYNRSLDKSIDHHIQASRSLGVEKGLDKFTRHDD
jgi:type I site-specific restriction-modification system R (restriction) subunit